MKTIPKYVEKLLNKRMKLSNELNAVNIQIEDYCKSIGLDCSSDLYDNACLCTDVRIYCEFDAGITITRKAILEQLKRNNKEIS